MTAVPIDHLVALREECDDLWVEGFLTVGVTNAVRAGESAGQARRAYAAGTINIIVLTNATLTASAMVTVVQVVTEAKTAALTARCIRSHTGAPGATGTGTDAVVVVSGGGPRTRYAGTHTLLGELVGRLITKGVTLGLDKWNK